MRTLPRLQISLLSLTLSAALLGSLVCTATAKNADSCYDRHQPRLISPSNSSPCPMACAWWCTKDEPLGRSGFAHLFEHLMFKGSENHPGEFFPPFEQAGATNQNGTTNHDRTNYFENIPTTALDMALWMESDRMGHLLGAIDQKTLDEQRGVGPERKA